MLSISGSSDRRQSLVTGYAGRHEHVPVQRNVSSCDSLITLIPLLACFGAAAQRLTRWRHNRVVVSGAELCPILMTRTSSWIALRNPTFGKLWFATVVSGICVSAHEMAAIWVINSISTAGSHSTMLLSLMSTASHTSVFRFILPAGALADMMDRKKML